MVFKVSWQSDNIRFIFSFFFILLHVFTFHSGMHRVSGNPQRRRSLPEELPQDVIIYLFDWISNIYHPGISMTTSFSFHTYRILDVASFGIPSVVGPSIHGVAHEWTTQEPHGVGSKPITVYLYFQNGHWDVPMQRATWTVTNNGDDHGAMRGLSAVALGFHSLRILNIHLPGIRDLAFLPSAPLNKVPIHPFVVWSRHWTSC